MSTVLEVEDLTHRVPPAPLDRGGRRRRVVPRGRGRVRRSGGGVGVRQDHDRPVGHEAAPQRRPHHRRVDPAPRARTSSPSSEKEMCKVRGNDVGMIFQDPLTSLNPTMTIGRQIAESVRLHRGASKAEARDRALEVLALVEMPRPSERLDAYPHQLSGGLRQRVMIAMALACEPKAAHRRRAHHGPRRHHPGPDPRPHRRPPRSS